MSEADPGRRTPRFVWVVLAVSLALNMFVAGIAIGHRGRGVIVRQGGEKSVVEIAKERLSPHDRELVMSMLRDARRAFADHDADVRAAALAFRDELVRHGFNRAKAAETLLAARAKADLLRTDIHDRILDSLSEMSPDGRKVLALETPFLTRGLLK